MDDSLASFLASCDSKDVVRKKEKKTHDRSGSGTFDFINSIYTVYIIFIFNGREESGKIEQVKIWPLKADGTVTFCASRLCLRL